MSGDQKSTAALSPVLWLLRDQFQQQAVVDERLRSRVAPDDVVSGFVDDERCVLQILIAVADGWGVDALLLHDRVGKTPQFSPSLCW